MQVCAAEWLSQLSRQMEEEVFVSLFLCMSFYASVIVHVFDSSYPLPLFGSKSFVNSDSFEVHNQIIFLPLLPTSVHLFGLLGRWSLIFMMAFVDPPQDHLQQMSTVGHALALAGVATPQEDPAFPGTLANVLLGHLGMTMDTNIETWGANSREEVVEEINGTYLSAQDGQLRLINLAEKGVCKLADRYVRLRLGIPVDGGTMQVQPPVSEQMALQADQINQLQHSVQMALQAAAQAATTAATAAALSSTSATATSGQGATTPTQTQNQVAAERTVSVNLVANQVQEATCRKLTNKKSSGCLWALGGALWKGQTPCCRRRPDRRSIGNDQASDCNS